MDEDSKEFEGVLKKDFNNKHINTEINLSDAFSKNDYLYTVADASQLATTRKIGTMQNTLTRFKEFIKSLGGKEQYDER